MLHRPLISTWFFYGSILLLAGILFNPSSAMAGFQWMSPSSEPAAQAPMQSPWMAEQRPMVIQAPSQPVTRAPQSSFEEQPQYGASASSQDHVLVPPASASYEPSYGAAEEEKIVRGFANNVPLAVALRPILPPEYGFSAGSNVSLNTVVSWKGGQSWRPILEDMLRSAGLSMSEQGKMIHILSGAGREGPVASPSYQQPYGSAPTTLLSPPSQQYLQPPPSAGNYGYERQGGYGQPMPDSSRQAYGYGTSYTPSYGGPSVDTWMADRGETLHQVLNTWSRRANVELSWQAEYDYPVQATVTITGTFEDAVRGILSGFQEAQPQPIGTLHSSSAAGQSVLVIQVRGNNYSE
jgi:hypothetical protein